MKKRLVLTAMILLMFFASACSVPVEGVPDMLVEMEVAEQFANYSGSYQSDIIHHVDRETGIDSVNVLVEFPNDYGSWNYYGYGAYQYNKSADMWEIYDDFTWENWGANYSEESFVGTFEEEFHIDDGKGTYLFEIESIDLGSQEITGTFHIAATDFNYWDEHEEFDMNLDGTIPIYGDPCVGYNIVLENSEYEVGFELSIYRGFVIKYING